MNDWGFERGRVYNRGTDIHDRFGGQRQGGIITPSAHPLVIIITGEEGLHHGYADRLKEDGTFEYFGEGQSGDMTLKRRNGRIASHVQDGKDLLLFRSVKGGLRYEGSMICGGHHIEDAPDSSGKMRKAIVFELRRVEAIEAATEDVEPVIGDDLSTMREKAFAAAVEKPSKKPVSVTLVERSRAVRDYVVARACGKCEGCGTDAPFHRPNGVPYLEPHHIRKLGDGGPDDPRFVIGLCPNCHRRVHSGADGNAYNISLLAKMKAVEP